ncbi:MAG: dTDP-4-dehydrorhamnose reductase [Flavobacteriaceae bacterium]|jgi:dTDP-4-dehydrorhamnose reductase
MTSFLVTGANGQLGQCFKAVSAQYPNMALYLTDQDEVDLNKPNTLAHFYEKHPFEGIINCAAYTAVDDAEKDKDKAFLINAEGVKNLVSFGEKHQLKLLHFSTDYVFDGTEPKAYEETDQVNPISVYGASKAQGEEYVFKAATPAVVLRTSWLFSPFGHNFMKTILRLSNAKKQISIVNDQFGRPTAGLSLAHAVLSLLENPAFWQQSCYHYANAGTTTWFGFAQEIVALKNLKTQLKPIATKDYLTPAQRPKNAVLATERIEKLLPLPIPSWQSALQECLDHN